MHETFLRMARRLALRNLFARISHPVSNIQEESSIFITHRTGMGNPAFSTALPSDFLRVTQRVLHCWGLCAGLKTTFTGARTKTLQPSPDLFRSHQISSNPPGFLIAAHQKQHLLLLRVPHINQLKSLTDLNASLTPSNVWTSVFVLRREPLHPCNVSSHPYFRAMTKRGESQAKYSVVDSTRIAKLDMRWLLVTDRDKHCSGPSNVHRCRMTRAHRLG